MSAGEVLSKATGTAPPAEFDALAPEDVEHLAHAVTAAVHDRSALIAHAIDDSLRYLPGLLRGVAKRALGM